MPKTWAYCAEFPEGKIFEMGEVPEGWVDSPAKIGQPVEPVVEPKKVGRPKKVIG